MKMLQAQWDRKKFVSVGLDSDPKRVKKILFGDNKQDIPTDAMVYMFNEMIINATMEDAGVYKINSAFYETYDDGPKALKRTVAYINKVAPEIPVIADTKNTDIGNTNKHYAEKAFGYFKADAVTVNPYFGGKSLQPFLDWKNKGIIVLCRTSNDDSDEFQNQMILEKLPNSLPFQTPLYQFVAKRVSRFWNANKNCLLVVGGTQVAELGEVRKIADDVSILIPGIGAQKGDLEGSVKSGRNSRRQGIIVNSSRGIIFASEDKNEFANVAGAKTKELNNAIIQYI